MKANCAQTSSKLLTKVKRSNDKTKMKRNEDCARNNHQRKKMKWNQGKRWDIDQMKHNSRAATGERMLLFRYWMNLIVFRHTGEWLTITQITKKEGQSHRRGEFQEYMLMKEWTKTTQQSRNNKGGPMTESQDQNQTTTSLMNHEWERGKMRNEHIQTCFDPDKEDAHPFVQNSRPRERNTACYSLGPNALLIVLLVSSVQPQHEFGESRKLVCHRRTC